MGEPAPAGRTYDCPARLSGNTLTLTWPANLLGYPLLVQTNNLSSRMSSNSADWGALTGATERTTTGVTIMSVDEFYQLVCP